jgi:hypothetical protein
MFLPGMAPPIHVRLLANYSTHKPIARTFNFA